MTSLNQVAYNHREYLELYDETSVLYASLCQKSTKNGCKAHKQQMKKMMNKIQIKTIILLINGGVDKAHLSRLTLCG